MAHPEVLNRHSGAVRSTEPGIQVFLQEVLDSGFALERAP
jgi:hypothetical protein